jgi:hypothetical protein
MSVESGVPRVRIIIRGSSEICLHGAAAPMYYRDLPPQLTNLQTL